MYGETSSHNKQRVRVYSLRPLTLGRNTLVSIGPFTLSINIAITANVNAGGKTQICSGPIQSINDAFDRYEYSLIRCLVNPKTRNPFVS